MRTSTDGGDSWSARSPSNGRGTGGVLQAPAFSPDGDDIYLVYNAFTTPYRDDTTSARGWSASFSTPTWARMAYRARGRSYIEEVVGDPRASAQNNIVMEFLGDYVYAAATNEYAVAVWNDVRDGDVCGPVQSWRADVQADPSTFPEGRPAIQQECPATFGNTDIFAWSVADPTP